MLVEYSSSSDDEPDCKRPKAEVVSQLPRALTLLGPKQDNRVDEPQDGQKDGRIRSFPHERGNWATYVYIDVDDIMSTLEDIIEQCQHVMEPDELELHCCDEMHLSMSKTVVLQYHLIDSFASSLSTALAGSKCFTISFGDLKVYRNEERTRTFIAFVIDEIFCDQLKMLLHKVDSVLGEYRLPLFYKPPSFHVSFLWCLGDKMDLLNTYLEKFKHVVAENTTDATITMKVNALHCKSGNKEFTFDLT